MNPQGPPDPTRPPLPPLPPLPGSGGDDDAAPTQRGARSSDVAQPTVPRTRVQRSISQPPRAPVVDGEALGRFALREVLGKGGMGVVRLAHDPELGRPLAIKFLQSGSDDAVAQFLEEAQITAQLEHPNIVPVHDLGRDANGRPWISMKRIAGESLDKVIDGWRRSRPGALQEDDHARILGIFGKACDAVAFAHSRGVVHRDIKPHNIMVGEYGEVLLVDWGLARPLDQPADRAGRGGSGITAPVRSTRREQGGDHTLDGEVFGTPAYMPPEQARGQVDRIDERSDIFALGGVLYHMLTLQQPYQARTVAETLIQAARHHLTPPRRRAPALRIPKELQAIVLKAMAASPDDRYATVRDLQDDLIAWQSHRKTSAWTAGPIERALKFARRNRAAVFTGSLAAVALVVATVVFILSLMDARDRAESAAQRAIDAQVVADQQAERARAAEQDARLKAEAASIAADAATTARHEAEVNLADGMVDQGNAMLLAGRRLSGLHLLYEARQQAMRIGHSTAGADWSLVDAMRTDPVEFVACRPHAGDPRIVSVAGTSDGRIVVSVAADGTIAITDMVLGKVLHRPARLPGKRDNAMVMLPDESAIVVSDEIGTLACINLADGTDRYRVSTRGEMDELTVTPDGELLLTISGAAVKVWSARNGTPVHTFVFPTGALTIGVSPDSHRALVSLVGGSIRELDLQRLATVRTARPWPNIEAFSLAWSPDGGTVLCGMSQGTVLTLDAATLALRWSIKIHSSEVFCSGVFPGGYLGWASAHYPTIFELSTGRVVRSMPGAGSVTAQTAQGYRLVTSTNGGEVALWDVFPAECALVEWPAHDGGIVGQEISPDGRLLATIGGDRRLTMHDMASGMLVARIPLSAKAQDICFVSNQRLLVVEHDGALSVWTADKPDQLTPTPTSIRSTHLDAAVAPDGHHLAIAGSGGAMLIDLDTGDQLRLDTGREFIYRAVFSPDGRFVVTASSDRNACVFDATTGERIHRLGQHLGHVMSVAISPDSKLLATGSGDTSIVVWKLAEGEMIQRIHGHSGWVLALQFLGNDRLVSSDSAGQVQINDARSGRLLRACGPYPAPHQLSTDTAGTKIVLGGRDGVVRIWDLRRLVEAQPALDTLRQRADWFLQRGGGREAVELLQRLTDAGEPVRDEERGLACWLAGRDDDAAAAFERIEAEAAREQDVARRQWAWLCRRTVKDRRNFVALWRRWLANGKQLGPGVHRDDLRGPVTYGAASDRAQAYRLELLAGQRVQITMRSDSFRPVAVAQFEDGSQRQGDVPNGDTSRSVIQLDVTRDGPVLLVATTMPDGPVGEYTIEVAIE
ncbi:MAG: WD40 repeat domain-containing serine/threonine protein kinase [Planctomycetota bacterium]